ncbi:MAG: response regulator transcription factor [Verrucomicrobiaceae bacterium]|nr:response regulator transcription factor [Verrucomicrobiaceae bacterium]
MRILVVEDEEDLARHVAGALRRHEHDVEVFNDGGRAVEAALRQPPDLMVLDLNLPTMSGLTILSRIKQAALPTRVIILTARADVEHRIKGLNAGADDYMGKPFSMDELAARVNVLGRRGGRSNDAAHITVGDVVMDVPHRRLTRRGERVELSPREFEVLQILMREPGRVFSRSEICERIWQREHQYDTRTVEIFIMRLRKKLEFDGLPPVIHTVRGVGYQVLPVE